jgi:hypothetical protein
LSERTEATKSGQALARQYPAETTEAFLDGHVSAFAFFRGVPRSILYDNLKIAVAKICGDGKRERARAFTELVSHYLFWDRFGRPGKGERQGQGRGAGEVCPLELPDADPRGGELRRPQRHAGRTLPGAAGGERAAQSQCASPRACA